MRNKLLIVTLLFACSISITFSQVTEAEKKLRELNADTTNGLEKGRSICN